MQEYWSNIMIETRKLIINNRPKEPYGTLEMTTKRNGKIFR
jgi:hypothetical protein